MHHTRRSPTFDILAASQNRSSKSATDVTSREYHALLSRLLQPRQPHLPRGSFQSARISMHEVEYSPTLYSTLPTIAVKLPSCV